MVSRQMVATIKLHFFARLHFSRVGTLEETDNTTYAMFEPRKRYRRLVMFDLL